MKRLALILVVAGALAACSNGQTASTIAALESGLTAADDAALGYLQLPVCNGSNGPTCGNATIRQNIKTAAGQAYTLITQARDSNAAGTTPDLTAAEAALSAYQTIITQTKGS